MIGNLNVEFTEPFNVNYPSKYPFGTKPLVGIENNRLRTPWTYFMWTCSDGDGTKYLYPISLNEYHVCGFLSYEDAMKHRVQSIQKWESTEHVAAVLRNADFTEGRGPMLLDKVFSDLPAAERYIAGNEGIYGSPQRRELYLGINITSTLFARLHWNGYTIEFTELRSK